MDTCVPPISLPHLSANLGDSLCLLPPCSHFPFSPNAVPAKSHPLRTLVLPRLPRSQTQGAVLWFRLTQHLHRIPHGWWRSSSWNTVLPACVFLLPNSLQSLCWAILPNFPMFECPRVQILSGLQHQPPAPSLKYHLGASGWLSR